MERAMRGPLELKPWLRLARACHRAALLALRHDCLNLSQSAAYSAIIALFPALIVTAALVALLPDAGPVRMQLGPLFDRILPAEVSEALTPYFAVSHTSHSTRALVLAGVVSLMGASSVIATLMEGVRRANGLPMDCWTVWQRRGRAFLLVPLSLGPLILASGLVIFGHIIADWLSGYATEVRPMIFLVALVLRWLIAVAGVVGLTALIYHMGTPLKQHWLMTLPGACVSTAMWFLTTLVFGWYVTRFANYTQIYGSLGSGIALLVWLYLVFLSVLCGAEVNAAFFERSGQKS
ncbi:YihY/virulence factor BrkB family protein [Granulicella sp. WH15]|nr:YihY/virulence factor BrkB family protein [Granulicella sp. WH15]